MRAEPRWSWTNESGEHCLQPVSALRPELGAVEVSLLCQGAHSTTGQESVESVIPGGLGQGGQQAALASVQGWTLLILDQTHQLNHVFPSLSKKMPCFR